jgi:hypothetical protein
MTELFVCLFVDVDVAAAVVVLIDIHHIMQTCWLVEDVAARRRFVDLRETDSLL